MHILSPLPIKNTLFASPKPSKIMKNQPKMQATHELEKRKASKVDFHRFLMIFGVPREGRKSLKIEKKAFQKSIEKKDEKKKAITPVGGEGRRQSCSPGNPKIPFRKALAKSRKQV